jgi:hypothetical protein
VRFVGVARSLSRDIETLEVPSTLSLPEDGCQEAAIERPADNGGSGRGQGKAPFKVGNETD